MTTQPTSSAPVAQATPVLRQEPVSIYPPGPASVPATLSRPSPAYRRHAWLALAGLVGFIALYAALVLWFAGTAWQLLRQARDGFSFTLAGGCCAFFALFLLKGLLFFKRAEQGSRIELTEAAQPQLFEFLHRLADEAGAPRPHKVFASARVNASVSYDLSLLNLILPSRKNLEIGLGLVNALNLGEFKAVCAHEFGHFAQRSMAVGRWVYIAQQVAQQIVTGRDRFDRALDILAHASPYLAWLGYLLQLVAWALRALVDTAFTLLLIAQRALSREMEMQADLVAVSLTGSDALVHALHRLNAADEAWARTLDFIDEELRAQREPLDAYALHTRMMAHLRRLRAEPGYGLSPTVPAQAPEAFRVFQAEIAQPPRMWATHPFSHEREANAKRQYVAAAIDDREAWSLFADPAALRQTLTTLIFAGSDAPRCPADETLARLDAQFARQHLKAYYHGLYHSRPITRTAPDPEGLYASAGAPLPALDALYSHALGEDFRNLEALISERDQLELIEQSRMQAPGGHVIYRGERLSRASLAQTVGALNSQIDAGQAALQAHERAIRSAHRAAAQQLGGGWPEYLHSMLCVLHYAEHCEADIFDARRCLRNRVAMGTVTRRVSSADIGRIAGAAGDLYHASASIYRYAPQLSLNATLCTALSTDSWAQWLGQSGLCDPDECHLGQWLDTYDSWISDLLRRLGMLRRAALDALLAGEEQVRLWAQAGAAQAGHDAPACAQVGNSYRRALIGQERTLQTQHSLWVRFQTADGLKPAIGRLAAGCAVIAAVSSVGELHKRSTIHIYNGLARIAHTTVCGVTEDIYPGSTYTRSVAPGERCDIVTTTMERQQIEAFASQIELVPRQYVYNIGAAVPLWEWTKGYGSESDRPAQPPVAERWFATEADDIFEPPPDSISHGSGIQRVLSTPQTQNPDALLDDMREPAQRAHVIAMHARWDATDTPYFPRWMALIEDPAERARLVRERLQDKPDDVIIQRMEQDSAANATERETICNRHREHAKREPANGAAQYLALRCIANHAERDAAFIATQQRYPHDVWLAGAAGQAYAAQADWRAALRSWRIALGGRHPLSAMLAVDVARVERLVDDALSLQELTGLAHASPPLQTLLSLEHPELSDTPYRAYAFLQKGAFDAAVAAASKQGSALRIMRLLTASEIGKGHSQTDLSTLNATDGIDSGTVWSAYALAYRNRKDTRSLVGHFPSQADAALAQDFLAAARRGNIAAAEAQLVGTQPERRGQLYCMGVVLLGSKAPWAWREGAKRLLFASERPYLR